MGEDTAAGATGTLLLDRPETDDGSNVGAEDWYTVKGESPWRMSCGASGIYVVETACPHRIIVWPSENDPNLTKLLKAMMDEDGERGQVVAYEQSLGNCVSFYEMSPS